MASHLKSSPSAHAHASHHHTDELLWDAASVNLDALEHIVCDHFRSNVCLRTPMNVNGSYARVFLFTVDNDLKVIGRIVLPVREAVKTEAEVAAMDMVRSRTNIPVPQVYLYCSSPQNPVRAEWILMEYISGETLGDCFGSLTFQQKMRTATELAIIMSSLFNIKAARSGSLNLKCGRDDRDFCLHSLRYHLDTPNNLNTLTTSADSHLGVGPINDVTFLDYPRQVSPSRCGPFRSELEFLEAFAFRGHPPTRSDDKLERWAFEKVFEVYHAVRPLYRGFGSSSNADQGDTFHFSHGDLSSWNVLIDPESGGITGVIDWEMAGFRPAWLAAVGCGWFNDDSDRFLMTDDQDGRLGYAEDTPADTRLRTHFRLQLAERSMELFRHYWLGVELRAIFYSLCHEYPGNAEVWLEKYENHEWDVARRGRFPFDLMAWIEEKLDLEERLQNKGS